MKRLCESIIIAISISFLMTSPSALGQKATEYEVYAIGYGYSKDVALSEFIPGVASSRKIDASFMVWLIKGEEGVRWMITIA